MGGVANTFSVGCVDVRDVARAHVAAIEKPEASGRCVTCAPHTHTCTHMHARALAPSPPCWRGCGLTGAHYFDKFMCVMLGVRG